MFWFTCVKSAFTLFLMYGTNTPESKKHNRFNRPRNLKTPMVIVVKEDI